MRACVYVFVQQMTIVSWKMVKMVCASFNTLFFIVDAPHHCFYAVCMYGVYVYDAHYHYIYSQNNSNNTQFLYEFLYLILFLFHSLSFSISMAVSILSSFFIFLRTVHTQPVCFSLLHNYLRFPLSFFLFLNENLQNALDLNNFLFKNNNNTHSISLCIQIRNIFTDLSSTPSAISIWNSCHWVSTIHIKTTSKTKKLKLFKKYFL